MLHVGLYWFFLFVMFSHPRSKHNFSVISRHIICNIYLALCIYSILIYALRFSSRIGGGQYAICNELLLLPFKKWGGKMFEEEYEKNMDWHDGMDFESVVRNGLEEEDNMDSAEAGFMRGFLEEEGDQNKKFFPEAGTVDFQEIPPFEL